jgi:type II secretory pathway predicted ATPase ExeA
VPKSVRKTHAALAQRVVAYTQLTAKTDPALVNALLDHGLAAAAAPPDLITPEAREMLLRATHGIPRLISHMLRISLILADERGQSSIDPAIVNTATILLHLEAAKPVVMPLPKPRLDRDPRSRG